MGLTADQYDNVLETEKIPVLVEHTQSKATRPVLYEFLKVAIDIIGMSFDTITTNTRHVRSVYSYAEQFSKKIVAFCIQRAFSDALYTMICVKIRKSEPPEL